jgi:hypothetical protein
LSAKLSQLLIIIIIIIIIYRPIKSSGSTVGIASDYGLDYRGVGVRVPIGSRIFTFHIFYTDSVAHTTAHTMGTGGGLFPRG